MKRENILSGKHFIVFREKVVGDKTIQVPEWAGFVHDETAPGWFLISVIRMSDFQHISNRNIKVEVLEDAEFYFFEPHFKSEYERLLNEAAQTEQTSTGGGTNTKNA